MTNPRMLFCTDTFERDVCVCGGGGLGWADGERWTDLHKRVSASVGGSNKEEERNNGWRGNKWQAVTKR